MSPARIAAATAVAALVLVSGACSSKGSTTSAQGSSTTSSAAGSGGGAAADPNAPEVNAAGDIPDNQVFVAYSPTGSNWSVKVPEGWARTDVSGGAVFTDKFNSVDARSMPAAAAATVESAKASEVRAVIDGSPNVTNAKVSSVPRAAGDTILITYQTDSAPNAVTGKSLRLAVERYQFFRDGTEVVLTLSGPVGADNVDPWKIVTDGFAWQ